MLNDLIAGVIDFAFDYAPTALPQVRSGRLQALAVTSTSRADFAPTLPSISEVIPGFQATAWQGLFAPAKTPKAVVDKLSAEVAKITATPAFKQRAIELGAEADYLNPQQMSDLVKQEVSRWTQVVKAAKIEAD